ncbi:TIGR03905 family TSCPD domain-containing protein [[Clostridium] colinum]|uniref:TIGR03905 family TSCPD domain-containing protein n=1 Tax=[Clostridium] colinum TaxID=36835 RepID=UPI0020244176|nr:TIGR03905 family TSCPD domain-containing protein [[Clostridium] colinum]
MNNFNTKGVCAKNIEFEVEGDIVRSVKFNGGCSGNLKGIASLVEGLKVEDVIKKLDGLTCGNKDTSCPDQLAKALKEVVFNK